MIRVPQLLEDRKQYTDERLAALSEEVGAIPELTNNQQLCIYVTGSYARAEASPHSDLDLFFVREGSSTKESVSRITKTLVDAELIKISRRMDFLDFSGDGEYLHVHFVEDMKDHLGSPTDDFQNLFTARLLLLLESRPVYNPDLYRRIVDEIIQAYYRDYHDHTADFKPIFLVNDIIRFWKTLCLNYEHRRNRPREDEAERNKNHLKNLKLKFSRMLTCFSSILVLSKNRSVIRPEEVAEIVFQTPLDRLQSVLDLDGSGTILEHMLADYAWFLEATGRPKEEVLVWIGDEEARVDAFRRAKVFGDNMYKLLNRVSEGTDTLRYLAI